MKNNCYSEVYSNKYLQNLRNSVKDDSQKNQTIPSPIVPSTDKNFETACEKCRGDKLERGKRRVSTLL